MCHKGLEKFTKKDSKGIKEKQKCDDVSHTDLTRFPSVARPGIKEKTKCDDVSLSRPLSLLYFKEKQNVTMCHSTLVGG